MATFWRNKRCVTLLMASWKDRKLHKVPFSVCVVAALLAFHCLLIRGSQHRFLARCQRCQRCQRYVPKTSTPLCLSNHPAFCSPYLTHTQLSRLFGGGSAEKLDEMNTSMVELKEEAAERNVKLEKLLQALTEKLDNVEGTLKSQSTDMRSVRGEVARNTTNMSKISEDVQTVKSLHLNP